MTEQILAMLVAERDRLNRAIEALQGTKRRGRPPKSATAATSPVRPRRRTFTAGQRAQQAARMRAYWAKRRKRK
jgi:hypothetical protein